MSHPKKYMTNILQKCPGHEMQEKINFYRMKETKDR